MKRIEIEEQHDSTGYAFNILVKRKLVTLGYGLTRAEAYREMRLNWQALVIDGAIRGAE